MSSPPSPTDPTAHSPVHGSDSHGHDSHSHGDHGHHEHRPELLHHFDTPQQQFDAAKLGMWAFLVTEVLFFGGLFCAYAAYRANHPEIFEVAHTYLDKTMGAVNTCVLIFSSLTMAWAVRAAQLGQRTLLIAMLGITIACAWGFMYVKTLEYHHKYMIGTMPGRYFKPTEAPPKAHASTHHKSADAPHNSKAVGDGHHHDPHHKDEHDAHGHDHHDMPVRLTVFGTTLFKAKLLTVMLTTLTLLVVGHTAVIIFGRSLKRSFLSLAMGQRFLATALSLVVLGAAIAGLSLHDASADDHDHHAEGLASSSGSVQAEPAQAAKPASPEVVDLVDDYGHPVRNVGIFFSIYFCMTGLHGIHVLIGIGLIGWLMQRAVDNEFGPRYFTPVDLIGLYWHIVDLVWIYLFPLLYLIN